MRAAEASERWGIAGKEKAVRQTLAPFMTTFSCAKKQLMEESRIARGTWSRRRGRAVRRRAFQPSGMAIGCGCGGEFTTLRW